MKPNLLLIFFLLINLSCYANSRNFSGALDTIKRHKTIHIKKTSSPFLILHHRSSLKTYKPWFDNCTFINEYTIAQRLKKYPFSKAAKILAVSFNGDAEPNPPINFDSIKRDTQSYAEKQLLKGLTIINDRLDYSTTYEIKTLNQNQIIHLTNILYNTAYKKALANTADMGYTCYNPRNAFVFLNKQGRVIDYLEICFECKNYKSKYGKLTIGDYCRQKFDMLRMCFINAGIKHGTGPYRHGTWQNTEVEN